MNNTDTKLKEQEARLKNTDNAFVKVNKDGSPGIETTDASNTDSKEKASDNQDELKHR